MSTALDGFREAYGEGFKFHNDNVVMLSWYSQRVIRAMQASAVTSCLSLGIGHKIVSCALMHSLEPRLQRYVIIEGSGEFIREFKANVPVPPHVSIVHSLFEEFETGERFDAIEMGFVLEHVDDPMAVLKQFSGFLRPGGTIFIAVPNARSLHRLIGHRSGMLEDLYLLNQYDLRLGHKRYFDEKSLRELVSSSGLKIIAAEGIFLKPFSTAQMQSLNLSPEVIESLCAIGAEYPGISNALYIEASL